MMKRAPLIILALALVAPARAQNYASPAVQNLTVYGQISLPNCNGYMYANGSGPVACSVTSPNFGVFIGDTGAGGVPGLVPAPPAGAAASGLMLGAGGVWTAPTISALSGQVTAAQLIAPTGSTLGAVFAKTCGASQWLNSLASSGVFDCAQPSFSNISGVIGAAQIPAPTASTFGGIKSGTAPAHQFQTGVNTFGLPTFSQPVASDVSGLAASAIVDTTDAANISAGTLAAARGGTGAGALTTGSIPFIGASGVYSQDNASLFWDAANQRLGLGTATPQAQSHIVNLNYAPTATNFLGQPSGVPNGVGNGAQTIYFKRTGGVGQYGYNLTLVEVEAESTGEPLNRRSDHALTAWINANNVMSGGRINGFWLGANSPATAKGHSFASGTVSGGEADYGNISGDFGIRTTFSNLPSTVGLLIAPDPTPNTEGAAYESTTVTVGSPAVFHKTAHGYSAGMGIKYSGAQAVAAGLTENAVYYVISTGLTADDYRVSTTREGAALNLAGAPTGAFNALPSWPGTFGLLLTGSVHGHQTGTQIHIQEDSIRAGGYGVYAKGSTVVSALTAPAGIVTGFGHWTRGIDFQSATFVSDAIRLADAQILRLGSATMQGASAGSLNVSTLGTGTTGRLLANGGAQEVIRWGANGTPAPILSFYGATPIPKPVVTDSRGGNAALASLVTALATLGLVIDSTTP